MKYDLKEQKKIISDMFKLYEASSGDPEKNRASLFLWLSVIFPLLKEEVDHKDNECRIVTATNRGPYDSLWKPCIKEIKFEIEDIVVSRMR